jgi:hypothetical protein
VNPAGMQEIPDGAPQLLRNPNRIRRLDEFPDCSKTIFRFLMSVPAHML